MPYPPIRSDRLHKIGLILPAGLTYARQILSGISESAHQNPHIELNLISETGQIDWEFSTLPKDLSGILAFTSHLNIDQARRLHPHVVGLSNRVPILDGDFVVADDREVGRMGAEYFLRRGFQNFAFVHTSGHQYSSERKQGFEERLREAGQPSPHIILCDPSNRSLIPEITRDLPVPCAVLAANDIMARIFMDLIPEPHHLIPSRVALLGVDNDDLHRSLAPLPLSSIELDGAQVGRLALKLLLERIKHPEKADEVIRVPPLRIQSRLTTDVYEVGDPRVVEALEVMDEHLSELRNIHDLMERLATPRRTLELHFRASTGRSPAKYLTQLRVERARDLLRSTSLTIEQIAIETGYSDARLLWQHFKNVHGQTPSAFRNELRGNTTPGRAS